jgi:hypothetical protein
MEARGLTRVLVVADRTTATPRLLEDVRQRATAGPCEFAVIVPGEHSTSATNWTPENALSLVRRAAQGRAELAPHGPGGFRSVERAVRDGTYDQIVVSVRPTRFSRLLKRDLLRRTERLGLPVTAILPRGGLSNREAAKRMAEEGFGV